MYTLMKSWLLQYCRLLTDKQRAWPLVREGIHKDGNCHTVTNPDGGGGGGGGHQNTITECQSWVDSDLLAVSVDLTSTTASARSQWTWLHQFLSGVSSNQSVFVLFIRHWWPHRRMEVMNGLQPVEVSRVAVWLPPFWAERPAMWFAQGSILSGRHQQWKVEILSWTISNAAEVEDVIASPPQQDP
jgi:hypothetical protein